MNATPPRPWLTPQQIAGRFVGLTGARVFKLAGLVGIHDSTRHRRWCAANLEFEYSPEAVGLIEREAKGRGYVLRVRLH